MSLAQLFTWVHDYLAAKDETAGVSVVFGDREPTKQINQGAGRAARVVFVPGDDSGSLGEYGPPRHVDRRTRHLWSWGVTARVYVWAYDSAAPEKELAQWQAAVELHDYVVEAIHAWKQIDENGRTSPRAAGWYQLSSPRKSGRVIERKFGYELVFLLSLDQAVLGETKTKVAPVTGNGQTLLVNPDGGTEQGC